MEAFLKIVKKWEAKYPEFNKINPATIKFFNKIRELIPKEAADEDIHAEGITERERFDMEVRDEFNQMYQEELKKRREDNPPCFFMVFEYLEHDLSGILSSSIFLREEEIKYIFQEIIHGMDYMHNL